MLLHHGCFDHFWRQFRHSASESATSGTSLHLGQDHGGLSPCFINAVLCGAVCHAVSCTTAVTIDYDGVHQHSANSKPAIKFNNSPPRPTLCILQPHTTQGHMFRLTTAPATPLTKAPPRARPAAPGVLSCHYPTLLANTTHYSP